jgi:hypothetical protein
VTARDERADHADHPRDGVRGAWLVLGLEQSQRGEVFFVRPDEALGERLDRFPVLVGALDDLVVDVRDVANVGDAVAALAQPASDHVEDHEHACVSQVAVVVDRHPAHVHAHLAGTQRSELLLRPAEGIVDREHAL